MEQLDSAAKDALYLVFDGGGARGVAHVAAWRVLEEALLKQSDLKQSEEPPPTDEPARKRYFIAGVAGTSAGAIAAAFIAAGAKASDLIDDQGRVPICQELGLDAFHHIFGLRGWRRLQNLRTLLQPSKSIRTRISKLISEDENHTPEAEVADPISNHTFIDKLLLLVMWCILLPVLIDLANDFSLLLVGAPYFFLITWLALYASFILTAKYAKSAENAARKKGVRKFSPILIALVRPFASIVYALFFSLILSLLLKYTFAFVASWLPRLIVQGLSRYSSALERVAWALNGLFLAITLIVLVRKFLKGNIEGFYIQEDLNAALCVLLTRSTCIWDNNLKKHIWSQDKASPLARRIEHKNHIVTFRDLLDETGIPLTIVAADVIQNTLCVYSSTTTPNESVAKAISASIAIPFAFRPVQDKNKLLVDGGIISSIPAWVYRRDRNRDPDCKILAIRIEPNQFDHWILRIRKVREDFIALEKQKSKTLNRKVIRGWIGKLKFLREHGLLSVVWPFALLANTLSTGAFGARSLELDASDRLESVILRSNLDLLDFDIGKQALVEELSRIEAIARPQIENHLWLREETFRSACQKIQDFIRSGIANSPSNGLGRVRMFWADLDGTCEAVRIKQTFNFAPKEHLDDRLVMPFGSSMSALAAETGKSQFANKDVLNKLQSGRMNRYRAAVKWKDLAWCWAIPIHANNDLKGVFAIESDRLLGDFDALVGREAEARSARWPITNEQQLPSRETLLKIANASTAADEMAKWETIVQTALAEFIQLKA